MLYLSEMSRTSLAVVFAPNPDFKGFCSVVITLLQGISGCGREELRLAPELADVIPQAVSHIARHTFTSPPRDLLSPVRLASIFTHVRRHGLLRQRSDLNDARSSAAKSFGCSHAAKCPPLSSLL